MSKRAFIVGINDFQGVTPLRGCVNDTHQMRENLTSLFGFDDDQVRVIHDEDATAAGIRAGLDWLLSDYAGDGSDVRLFHFSSHGTQVDDDTGDEWECQDEVIVTYDHDWDNPFRDDHLREIFSAIPENVNFTFVADCCHSGSIQRRITPDGIEFTPRYVRPPREIDDRIKRMKQKRDLEGDSWAAEQLAEALKDVPPEQWAARMQEELRALRERYKENKYQEVDVDRHVLLAACQDKQTAADAHIEGDYRGAFTWGLSTAINESNGQLTYGELIRRAAENMDSFEQIPQLECPPALRDKQVLAPLA